MIEEVKEILCRVVSRMRNGSGKISWICAHLPEPKKVSMALMKRPCWSVNARLAIRLKILKIILQPMALGEEATGSMGADTPLAVLSDRPKPLYEYFKQLFAQVTNPPIDAIREEIIMGEDMMLGPESNLLEEGPQHCHRLWIQRPMLTNEELEKISAYQSRGIKSVDACRAYLRKKTGLQGLRRPLRRCVPRPMRPLSKGGSILILSDRDISAKKVPIPSLLACAGLHHHLIRQGTRTKVSIVVETGEARELHHFAVLIGYGANAVNPYLAFETIEAMIKDDKFELTDDLQRCREEFSESLP